MFNWNNLTILFYGVLGTLALLLIQWLIGFFLPNLPYEVMESARQVRQTTLADDFQGDADLFNFDRALMEAELVRPGSTFRIYYNQPAAVFSRLLGSILVSFTITGWVLGNFEFACMSLSALFFGIGLLLYPYLTWESSRPKLPQ